MQYELYIDVLFLENLFLDYLLLSLLKTILKCRTGSPRRLLGAAIGSVGACLYCILFPWGNLAMQLLISGIFGVGMVKLGLHEKGWRGLGKPLLLLYVFGVFLAGAFEWIQQNLNFPVASFLGISSCSYFLLSAGMKGLFRLRCKEQNLYQVRIIYQGKTCEIKALRDTGNCLRDPIFGKPVSLISKKLQRELCGEQVPHFLVIPFHSVGEPRGILQGFFADGLYIDLPGGQVQSWERPLLGISKEPLSSKDEYDMILHPELLE